jgi:hypothetical protein
MKKCRADYEKIGFEVIFALLCFHIPAEPDEVWAFGHHLFWQWQASPII